METKENEKLLALTKLIGRKDLSFGCKIILKDFMGEKTINQLVDGLHNFKVCGDISKVFWINDVEEIIGHPLLLSDILNGLSKKGINYCIGGDYFYCGYDDFYKNDDFFNYYSNMIELDLSLPLFSQQSEDFKTFIYEAFNIK